GRPDGCIEIRMKNEDRGSKMEDRRLKMVRTLTLLLFLNAAAQAQAPGWPQWGGPQRNFMVESKGLAATWPADGPKRLWSRELGEGHSAIVVDAGRLYTMYSKGEQEFVVALDSSNGKTIWEKGNAA